MSAAPYSRSKGTGRDPQLNLLIIRPGAIGDTIVSLPALEYLCAQASYSEVWCSPACAPLIRFASRVRSIPSTGLDLVELGLDTPALASLGNFQRIISWYGTGRDEFRAAVRDYPFEFHHALPAAGTGEHAVDFYLRQVGAPAGAVPAIPVTAPKRDFVACQPFSGSPRKNWLIENFRALAHRFPVEFCAGPDEDLPGARQFDSLADVAEWLAGARAYVGNDSGISHLAAAVGVPTVAIFRGTDPQVWAPRGRALVQIIRGDPGVDEVVDAIEAVLRG